MTDDNLAKEKLVIITANIGNGCTTAQQGMNVIFPNPGSFLEANAGPFNITKQSVGNCDAANGPGNPVVPTGALSFTNSITSSIFAPVSSVAVPSASTTPDQITDCVLV
jgi:hypothetical protein